ncbi:3-isopropylmalate dehydratase small subunit [Plebeiibacterium marinum]|uniref:3-isopropylmalate dehydratase small subunit n=1 Tax=Plebeiibacterium marinum TaxID=2992111 RepID=A0AAE3MCR2_9BACT|nr:3-isopropylmalate dehydratase small subunit [Plebeiobacterium marinum]MCW3805234.1 3-isopropylmalate dehydratase small subunit [Plebeiobacterium marinum]
MPIDKFVTLESTYYPLPIENVDTDQIIPARFLKATTKEGFGDNLFADWRYNSDGTPKADFVLNKPEYTGSVLVAGKNFGSGSSREHAAWAVHGFGFKVVVSSFFADIFKNNSLNNGVLPVVISEGFLADLFAAGADNKVVVNLEEQTITNTANGKTESFEINSYKKNCLLNGFDDIDYLISVKDEIETYENGRA